MDIVIDDYRNKRRYSQGKLGLIQSEVQLILKYIKLEKDNFLSLIPKWPTISEFIALKNCKEELAKFHYESIVELYRKIFMNARSSKHYDLMQFLIKNRCIINPFNIMSLRPVKSLCCEEDTLQMINIALNPNNLNYALDAEAWFAAVCKPNFVISKVNSFATWSKTILSFSIEALKLAMQESWVVSIDIIFYKLIDFCNHHNLNYPKLPIDEGIKDLQASKEGLQNLLMLDCLEQSRPQLKGNLTSDISYKLEGLTGFLEIEKKRLLETFGFSSVKSVLCIWDRAMELRWIRSYKEEPERLMLLFVMFTSNKIPLELFYNLALLMMPKKFKNLELVCNYFFDAPKLATLLRPEVKSLEFKDSEVIAIMRGMKETADKKTINLRKSA